MSGLRPSGAGLVLVMSLTQAAGLLGFAVLPALLPGFIAEWQLSGSDAGWLGGIFFAGYMAAVPVLSGLTDRVDARRICIVGNLITLSALLGFAMLAQGFWTALAFRAMLGVGFAGTYMPGLRVLTDRLARTNVSRGVAFYTASYGIGASLSVWLAGEIDAELGWRWAAGLTSLGPLWAMLLVILFTGPVAPPAARRGAWLLDFRPILANRRALGYMLAYALHNWELGVVLSWTVAFLAFSAGLQADGALGWNITLVGAVVAFVALPASVLGNEAALRFGRRRAVSVIMLVSAGLGCAIGFAAAQPFWVVAALVLVYGATTAGDSASVTAGTVMAARPEERGAAMAVHSFIGFAGTFAGPLVFGVVLDLAGGATVPVAWGIAFAVAGLGAAVGVPVLAYLVGDDGD